MAFSLGQTALYPALPAIADQLHVSIDAATWSITAYLLSAAVCTPVVGRLSDVDVTLDHAQVVLWMLIVGGVVAAATGTLAGLICGRIIQAGRAGCCPSASPSSVS